MKHLENVGDVSKADYNKFDETIKQFEVSKEEVQKRFHKK